MKLGAVLRSGYTLSSMNVRPDELSHREFYRILISAVAPHPIAWVSTLSDGRLNFAPFSFFNVVSAKPPLLGVFPLAAPDRRRARAKGHVRNVRDTGEFVVNVVTFKVAEAMNLTSGDYEISINEFELAKLTTRPSQVVRPPQGGITGQLRVQTESDYWSWQRAPEWEPGDRRDRFGSPGGRGFERRTTRPGLAGSDWTHGRRTVFPHHRTL